MPFWGQFTFQDGSSPVMAFVSNTYDLVCIVCVGVIALVAYVSLFFLLNKSWNYYFVGLESLETMWVILPSLALASLVLPSLHCLYLMDEIYSPSVTLKVIGHQWYWSYEYGDWDGIEFDSYMLSESDLNSVEPFRLLESDCSVYIPSSTEIRAIITSSDVIHSWAIPSLSVKMDAVPGRLNHSVIYSHKLGSLYGQCSEMCGAYHSFMPISIKTVPKVVFISWAKSYS
nr:cytochrome c oxidase subunit 2 [Pthirus gorillae]